MGFAGDLEALLDTWFSSAWLPPRSHAIDSLDLLMESPSIKGNLCNILSESEYAQFLNSSQPKAPKLQPTDIHESSSTSSLLQAFHPASHPSTSCPSSWSSSASSTSTADESIDPLLDCISLPLPPELSSDEEEDDHPEQSPTRHAQRPPTAHPTNPYIAASSWHGLRSHSIPIDLKEPLSPLAAPWPHHNELPTATVSLPLLDIDQEQERDQGPRWDDELPCQQPQLPNPEQYQETHQLHPAAPLQRPPSTPPPSTPQPTLRSQSSIPRPSPAPRTSSSKFERTRSRIPYITITPTPPRLRPLFAPTYPATPSPNPTNFLSPCSHSPPSHQCPETNPNPTSSRPPPPRSLSPSPFTLPNNLGVLSRPTTCSSPSRRLHSRMARTASTPTPHPRTLRSSTSSSAAQRSLPSLGSCPTAASPAPPRNLFTSRRRGAAFDSPGHALVQPSPARKGGEFEIAFWSRVPR